MKSACVPIAAILLAANAHAQTAMVFVTHDDPDGLVSPGETVRVRVRHIRSDISILAGIAGELKSTQDLGSASNIYSELRLAVHGQTYPASHGVATGGSVTQVSYEFVSHPIFVPVVQAPYSTWWGVDVLAFDWTAPTVATPTPIDFNWVPSSAYPDVYAILPPYSQFNWAFLPTTYTGASILVIPAPASTWLLAAMALPRRRR